MKARTLLFTFLFFANLALAQFGITGRYHVNDAPDWIPLDEKNASDPYQFLGDGWSVGIDYWQRLKNYRIEFLPELNYAQFSRKPGAAIPEIKEFSNQVYGFFLNTNVYPFDFAGDCHCPTFSKQGEFLKKGFFLQVSPGMSYWKNEVDIDTENLPGVGSSFKSSDWSFSIGAGAGLDIGVSDFVTFTPIVNVRYFPKVYWDHLQDYTGIKEEALLIEESAVWQWSAGARIGIRFDYQSNRRRR